MLKQICLFFLCFLLISSVFAGSLEEFPVPSQGKTGLYGYVDDSGHFIIKPQFEQALPFTEGIARVKIRHHWRLINSKGKFLTKSLYEEIRDFRNGVAVVSKRESLSTKRIVFGLVNIKGKEVVDPQYDYLTASPDQSMFIVGVTFDADAKGNTPVHFGVINAAGETIVPLQYVAIRDFNFKVFAVKNKQDSWQVFTRQKLPIFAGNYTDIKDFDEELATVKQAGKWGVINREGAMLVKAEYKNIVKKDPNHYELIPFTQWKVTNAKKEILLTSEYDNIRPVATSLYAYQSEGKFGLLSGNGERICEPQYDEIQPFTNDLTVVRNGFSFGVLHKKGNQVLPAQFQSVVIDSASSVIRVKELNKWGIYSRHGKAITPSIYDEIRMQPFGLFSVRQGTQWYLLDASGHVTGEASYDDMADFKGLYTVVKKHGRSGMINARGSWAIDPHYDSLHILNTQTAVYASHRETGFINLFTKQVLFSADKIEPVSKTLFKVTSDWKTGVYDCKGNVIIPQEYDHISALAKDSIFSVEKNGKKGLMSLQGKVVLRPSSLYQELHVMKEERVGVKINNKYGFIDRNGKLRIANRYEGIGSFSEDMVAVKIRGNWGFVDKAEELRVQPHYEQVLDFRNGVAAISKEGKWGFVNKKGKETVKPQYESIQSLPSGRYLVSKDGKKGLVTETGKELYTTKYDAIQDLGNGLILLNRGGKSGISDANGLDVLPLIYDYLYVDSSKNIFILGVVPQMQNFTYNR
ncbi:WG repeat-containing protein [Rhodocytophaga rosea]|uniref:WG repeat-containing protein n=1 Tax=Rhodocytophaga rosea TaxID=2704465 RepID=A0A6C0GKJ4_9BACT|nr:WG repeat-containing protein [Rhodocytophaga rosea]QHT68193.1 WG repeat-containing protein [Rhodocytophaga rosea]